MRLKQTAIPDVTRRRLMFRTVFLSPASLRSPSAAGRRAFGTRCRRRKASAPSLSAAGQPSPNSARRTPIPIRRRASRAKASCRSAGPKAWPSSPSAIRAAPRCARIAPTGSKAVSRRRASGRSTRPSPRMAMIRNGHRSRPRCSRCRRCAVPTIPSGIAVGRHPAPGNWLPVSGNGPMVARADALRHAGGQQFGHCRSCAARDRQGRAAMLSRSPTPSSSGWSAPASSTSRSC